MKKFFVGNDAYERHWVTVDDVNHVVTVDASNYELDWNLACGTKFQHVVDGVEWTVDGTAWPRIVDKIAEEAILKAKTA